MKMNFRLRIKKTSLTHAKAKLRDRSFTSNGSLCMIEAGDLEFSQYLEDIFVNHNARGGSSCRFSFLET